jgi:chromate transporter
MQAMREEHGVSTDAGATALAGEEGRVPSFAERFLIWVAIGTFSFGGRPLNLMYDEMVTRRGWLSREDYAEAFALGKLLPGNTGINAMILAAPLIRHPLPAAVLLVPYLVPGLIGALILAELLASGARYEWIEHALWGIGAAGVGIVASIAFDLLPAARSARLWLVSATVSFVATAILGLDLFIVLVAVGAASLLANRPRKEA